MQIIWHGQSCFQIIVTRSKGEQSSIVIDPFDESIGLRPPNLSANILLITHDHNDHNNKAAIKGLSRSAGGIEEPFLITCPGEYEIKEIFIQGVSAFHDDLQGRERGKVTIYTIEAEGLKLCHLSDLGQKELTPDQLQNLGDIDILMIPVGGVYTISSKEAPKIISQIDPRIVIPMHYQIPKLNPPAGGKLEGVEKFLKAMGQKSTELQLKLLIKKKDLPEGGRKIVVLKP